MARRLPTPPQEAAPAPRGPLLVSLALGLAGVVLSVVLARLHGQAHAGIASFCSISDVVNCDKVATSRYSVLLGLPVAVWGVLGYALAATLAATGLSTRRPRPGWPSGLLFLFAAAATAASAALALVSEFLIGAWCLLCMGSWAVAVALLAAAWRACRGTGVAASIRADVSVLRASPRWSLAAAGLLVAAIAVLAGVYPRYWQRARAPRALVAGSGLGAGVVVEYSDYECPMCARAHEETRALLARRPDVKLVRRQFPLDPSCNPAVKRPIHPTACGLARAGICAEAQGRLPEMDDALFRNQQEHLPVVALAERLGLDLPRFRDCLSSPETDRRLGADIGAALRDGVRATPTYVVGRTVEVGRLPEELLPPPPAKPSGG
jgi:uncharacterized membrane protein/predicted DsbA family dithiol-disulfide isomerase